MIKLIDIVREVQQPTRTRVEELNVGRLARTAAAAAGIGLASLGAPKDVAAQAPKSTTTINAPTKTSEWKAVRYVSNEKMRSWNEFQKWLTTNTFEHIDQAYYPTNYKAKGKLAGNKIMNQPGYSNMIYYLYLRLHQDTELGIDDIKKIQDQIKDYGDWIATTNQHTESAEAVTKSKKDGIIGEWSSTVTFPEDYIKDLDSRTTIKM